MTAMDLALELEGNVAAVSMLSGAPTVVDQWAAKLKRHKGVKVSRRSIVSGRSKYLDR